MIFFNNIGMQEVLKNFQDFEYSKMLKRIIHKLLGPIESRISLSKTLVNSVHLSFSFRDNTYIFILLKTLD